MGAFLRKYGTGTGADIYIPIIKRAVVDFAVSADWTPAAGDVKVSKDGGAAANIGTLPTAVTMGNTAMWKFVFADAELQCKVLAVTVADAATKAVEDQMLLIETYGHASAMYVPDFADGVRLGLTALPNAAADAAGGLPISDAGGLDLDAQIGTKINDILTDTGTTLDGKIDAIDNFVDTEIAAIISAIGTPANLGGGATLAANLSDIEAQTDDIGTAGAGLTGVPWNAAWDAEVQSEVQDAIEANHLDHLIASADPGAIVANSSLWAALTSKSATPAYSSYSNQTDSMEAQRDNMGTAQTGDAYAVVNDGTFGNSALKTLIDAVDNFVDTEVASIITTLGTPAGASLSADIAAIEAQTDDIGAAGAGLSAIPWNAAWDAEVQSEVDDALKATLTEGYRSTGAVGSVRDMLYELIAHMGESSNSGTTKTLKKIDGATTAKTYTYDDATTPTSITETT